LRAGKAERIEGLLWQYQFGKPKDRGARGESLMVQHYIEAIGQPDNLRRFLIQNLFTPTGRTNVGVIWGLSVKESDDKTCEFTNTGHPPPPRELLGFLGKEGVPWEVFQTARKPIPGADSRQETSGFAKSIDRHALRRT
jgi:hypothetical protein